MGTHTYRPKRATVTWWLHLRSAIYYRVTIHAKPPLTQGIECPGQKSQNLDDR